MNIALAAEGKYIDSIVSNDFEKCSSLIIIDNEDMSIKSVINNGPNSMDGVYLAREIIKSGCEAVITGKIQPAAFNILADAYITRYDGAGSTVEAALKLMEKNLLKLIKNAEGEQGCGGNHHH